MGYGSFGVLGAEDESELAFCLRVIAAILTFRINVVAVCLSLGYKQPIHACLGAWISPTVLQEQKDQNSRAS